MADIGSAFRAAIEDLGYGEAPERNLTTAEVSRIAREIAEREGIKYTSARRRLERRRTTGLESRGQPNRRFAAELRRRGWRVHAEVDIDPSPKPGEEEDQRPRTIDVELRGDQLAGVAAALERADVDTAEGEFLQALLREYEGVGEGDVSFLAGALIGDVEALEIDWLN